MATTDIDNSDLGQILIFQDGATRLQVRLEGHTVWLSQRLIAELFQVSVKTANEHLVNIYDEREPDVEATVRSFRIVQAEGSRQVTRAVDHYNLDAIQKITDIYATSIDYDATHLLSQSFFATLQNKLHFAIHGGTAAEVIKGRADAAEPRMGLHGRTRRTAPFAKPMSPSPRTTCRSPRSPNSTAW